MGNPRLEQREDIGMETQSGPGRLILLRLAGEIAIKSKTTRSKFRRQLSRNLRDALASTGEEYRVDHQWSRVYVHARAPEAVEVLARVFGIGSMSPVELTVPAEIDRIVEAGADFYRDRVRGGTFGIRTRRSGEHPFSSHDVDVQLGARLNEVAEVDLDDPDVRIDVEIRDRTAHLFTEWISGAGGLPLGAEGRAVALISGGFDSAVAAWYLLKRGVELDYVFCNLGGDAYERSVLAVVKSLADRWSYGSDPKLHVVDFGPALENLRGASKPRFSQVLLKRLMYRAGSRIGLELGADAIITGEAIGQVSSQTLPNLRAIEPAATLPVLRPLVGFDKNEIIDRAWQIGTGELSERVKEYCAVAPGRPVTGARTETVDRHMESLDEDVLDHAVENRRVLDVRSLSDLEATAPYVFITEIPDDAVVLDCRSEAHFASWHLPGAEHRDEWDLQTSYSDLDRDRTYVLYCAQGTRTARLAELMQREGYEAYSFRGGVGGLRRWAEEQEE